MEWRLFATVAEGAGTSSLRVDVGGDATVGDALDALLAAAPAVEARLYDADGEIYDHIRLLVDGESPFANGDGLDEPVAPDADLALMPAVSGG
jgi:molybdopterin synthase sulfur carrier subunit